LNLLSLITAMYEEVRREMVRAYNVLCEFFSRELKEPLEKIFAIISRILDETNQKKDTNRKTPYKYGERIKGICLITYGTSRPREIGSRMGGRTWVMGSIALMLDKSERGREYTGHMGPSGNSDVDSEVRLPRSRVQVPGVPDTHIACDGKGAVIYRAA